MNLPVIFTKALAGVKQAAGTGSLIVRKNADKLMLGGGVVSFVITIVETVKATNKTNEVLEYKEQKEALIEQESAANETYTPAIRLMDEKNLKRTTRIELVKIWSRPAVSAFATVIFFGGAWKIVNGRYVLVSAAYDRLDDFTRRYRRNVVDRFGKDVDWEMAHGLKAEEMEAERKAAEEYQEERKKKGKLVPRTQYSKNINNQIFDIHTSELWKRWWLPDQAIHFVNQIEREIQSMVETRGYAFLNEAYTKLGMPMTAQGQLVGWIKTPKNLHDQRGQYASLGFANDECPEDERRRILSSPSNEEMYIWITPNCDGVIYNLIDVPFHQR